MISFLNTLNARDRFALFVGMAVLILFMFYQFIYSPLVDNLELKTNQLKENKSTLTWLRTVERSATSAKKLQNINKARLLSLIGTEVHSDALQTYKAEVLQTGTHDIQLAFEQVPYHQIILWLWHLNNKYAIRFKQISIEKTDSPGLIKLLAVIMANE